MNTIVFLTGCCAVQTVGCIYVVRQAFRLLHRNGLLTSEKLALEQTVVRAQARSQILEIERAHVRMLLSAWPDESTIAAAERVSRQGPVSLAVLS